MSSHAEKKFFVVEIIHSHTVTYNVLTRSKSYIFNSCWMVYLPIHLLLDFVGLVLRWGVHNKKIIYVVYVTQKQYNN